MARPRLTLNAYVAFAAWALCCSPAIGAPVDFIREVRPIFEAKCFKCHGPEKQKSGFRLDASQVAFMVGKSGVHSAATLLQSTGFQLPGFPGAGCWVSYALGSENDNLPTLVVLPDHRGFASNGVKNWDAAFLPSQHSGTIIQSGTKIQWPTYFLVKVLACCDPVVNQRPKPCSRN